jgi:hypothetical protein
LQSDGARASSGIDCDALPFPAGKARKAKLVAQGVALALLVGLIGGLFPAIRAARTPIAARLYD